jgi:hypothetical protein
MPDRDAAERGAVVQYRLQVPDEAHVAGEDGAHQQHGDKANASW